jgi:hypothetical protein
MHEPNAFATLQQITGGYILSRYLHIVADQRRGCLRFWGIFWSDG